eukprot:TRINITY_DN83523_c0_g1_i1.p1 TRINITY_DN83523_c0_g1~~TRINITY_DN83523_c0_g1_i1.p1  ORF type:complete len:541 (+),score=104.64 TRINITY_DN83523_c0_g1_i1:67-1689(+)
MSPHFPGGDGGAAAGRMAASTVGARRLFDRLDWRRIYRRRQTGLWLLPLVASLLLACWRSAFDSAGAWADSASTSAAAPAARASVLVADAWGTSRRPPSKFGAGRRLRAGLISRAAAPPIDDTKVAVLMNLNAQGVSPNLVKWAKQVCGEENVFATKSEAEGEKACHAIVERRYGTVVAAGGDGTLTAIIGSIRDCLRDRYDEREPLDTSMPRFACLPLGTGNAVACLVGPPRHPETLVPFKGQETKPEASLLVRGWRRLRRLLLWQGRKEVMSRKAIEELVAGGKRSGQPGKLPAIRELNVSIVEVDGQELCLLGGFGFDALLLDDFSMMREHIKNSFMKPILGVFASVVGYFIAMSLRTLPMYISGKHRVKVKVQAAPSADAPVLYVDPRRGDSALPLKETCMEDGVEKPLMTLYEGPAALVSFGSCPFYGAGLRLLPFACSAPGIMQLRIAKLPPWRWVPVVHKIFAGTYRNAQDVFDFVGREFFVEASVDDSPKGCPLQLSGDARGWRKTSHLKVVGNVRFVDFLGMPTPLQKLRS